jgi:hypothetical protein
MYKGVQMCRNLFLAVLAVVFCCHLPLTLKVIFHVFSVKWHRCSCWKPLQHNILGLKTAQNSSLLTICCDLGIFNLNAHTCILESPYL